MVKPSLRTLQPFPLGREVPIPEDRRSGADPLLLDKGVRYLSAPVRSTRGQHGRQVWLRISEADELT